MAAGLTESEKINIKKKKIKELETKYSDPDKNLVATVITLYYGGKYSLYIYKRYTDVRLVMAPDVQIGATGWDWDNFTYPRYELDFAFLRAYENGKPIKVKNYFTWSDKGAEPGEPIFIVGNPGNTDRLLSVRQLEFFRNYKIPIILHYFNARYNAQFKYFATTPNISPVNSAPYLRLQTDVIYAGLYKALRDGGIS